MKLWRRVAALLLCVCLLVPLCGCHGAVCVSKLTITDASGRGSRICNVYSPVVNRSAFTDCEAIEQYLNEYLQNAIGQDAAFYTIRYDGEVSAEDAPLADSLYEMSAEERAEGYDVFSLSYDFSGIRDYNRKTRRLYNLSKDLAMKASDDTYRVGMLDNYVDTVLRVKEQTDADGNPTGLCDVTLTETGAVSYGVVAWAMIALYSQRANSSLWTSDQIYFAPFSPDETHTVFSALKTQLTVTVGETVRTVTPITGPVFEGQGEVEGIVFNVSGTLRQATEPGIASHLTPLILGLSLVAAALVSLAVMLIVWRRRRRVRKPQ